MTTVGPIIRLLLLMFESIRMFEMRRFVYNALSPNKYVTLDRISLMHSNNHKAERLSNRNLLNGPFHQRSMVECPRSNANGFRKFAIFASFSQQKFFVVVECIPKLRMNKTFKFNKLLRIIACASYFSGNV